jgi:hypothetical protein
MLMAQLALLAVLFAASFAGAFCFVGTEEA